MIETTPARRRIKRLVTVGVATASMAAGSLALGAPAAQATGTNVGYACGYYSNVSLFGGPYGSMGCGTQTSTYATANSAAPSVTLPVGGAYTGLTDSDGARATYGPADILSSPYDPNDNLTNTGALAVFTQGTTQISSQSKVDNVGPSPFWTQSPTSWVPPGFAAVGSVGFVKGFCTASSPTAKTLQTLIQNGRVDTHIDPNTGYPTSTVAVPLNPSPGYYVDFWIENISAQEHGRMVFNEQIHNADGSWTLNAAHMYMQGPIALGDVIIGQVTCGHA